MHDDAPDGSISPSASPLNPSPGKPRRPRWLLYGVMALVAFCVYVTFFPQPPTAQGVLTATANSQGTTTTGEVSSSAPFAAQATAIKSNVSKIATSTTSSSDGAAFPRRTAAIFSESDHLLMKRVSLTLFEKLREKEQFEELSLIPRGESLPVGKEVPDVLISLDMPALKVGGVPGLVTYDAKFTVTLGREYARTSHYNHSTETPPVVQYAWSMEADYKGQQTGLETSGAQYTAISADIAKQLQESIVDFLEKGTATDLPAKSLIAEYYPAYQPAPEFKFLQTLSAVPRLQGPRFMQPTYAVWTFTTDVPVKALAEQISAELTSPDWKMNDHTANEQQPSASWHRGLEELQLLRARESHVIPPQADPSAAETKQYVINYRRMMSEAESQAAFEALLARNPSEATLLPFINKWYLKKDLLQAHFARQPPQSPAARRTLAQWELDAGNTEQARELIVRGATFDRLLNQGQKQDDYKKLTEKAGLEPLPKTWDSAVIAQLGMVDFRDGQPLTIPMRAGEKRYIWLSGDEKEQMVLGLHLTRRHNGQWHLAEEVLQVGQDSSSFARSGGSQIDPTRPSQHPISHYGARVVVTPRTTPDPDVLEFEFTTR